MRRRDLHNLWRKLLEIATELQSNGHTFDLEDQQTWPTLDQLGNKVPKIYPKKFRNSDELRAGQVLAHNDRCDRFKQHQDSLCPGQQCCDIAFHFLNYLSGMKNAWPN